MLPLQFAVRVRRLFENTACSRKCWLSEVVHKYNSQNKKQKNKILNLQTFATKSNWQFWRNKYKEQRYVHTYRFCYDLVGLWSGRRLRWRLGLPVAVVRGRMGLVSGIGGSWWRPNGLGGGCWVRGGDSVGHSGGGLNAIACCGWVGICRGRLCAGISEYTAFLINNSLNTCK